MLANWSSNAGWQSWSCRAQEEKTAVFDALPGSLGPQVASREASSICSRERDNQRIRYAFCPAEFMKIMEISNMYHCLSHVALQAPQIVGCMPDSRASSCCMQRTLLLEG